MDGSERRLTLMFVLAVLVSAAIGLSFWMAQPAVGDCVRLIVHPRQPMHSACGRHYVMHGRLQEQVGGDRIRMRLDRVSVNNLDGRLAPICQAAPPPRAGECFRDDLSRLTGGAPGLVEYCLGGSIDLPAAITIGGTSRRSVGRALDDELCAPMAR